MVSDSLKGKSIGYLNDYQVIWKTLPHGFSYQEKKWKYRLHYWNPGHFLQRFDYIGCHLVVSVWKNMLQ